MIRNISKILNIMSCLYQSSTVATVATVAAVATVATTVAAVEDKI